MIRTPSRSRVAPLAAAVGLLFAPAAAAQGRHAVTPAGRHAAKAPAHHPAPKPPAHHSANHGAHHAAPQRATGNHHTTTARPGHPTTTPATTGDHKNAAVLAELHSTLATLAKTPHDYQGHRVRAMTEVGNAIQHLQGHATKGNTAGPALAVTSASTGSGAAAKASMTQAASDEHLRTALHSLKSIGTTLAGGGKTPQNPKAHASVQSAVQELNTALKAE